MIIIIFVFHLLYIFSSLSFSLLLFLYLLFSKLPHPCTLIYTKHWIDQSNIILSSLHLTPSQYYVHSLSSLSPSFLSFMYFQHIRYKIQDSILQYSQLSSPSSWCIIIIYSFIHSTELSH